MNKKNSPKIGHTKKLLDKVEHIDITSLMLEKLLTLWVDVFYLSRYS